MTINETSKLLNTLLSQTDRKTEKKLYNCFIKSLSSLESKGLTETQSKIIQEKLSSLSLKAPTENRKKYFKQKLTEFKAFLKNEFSFTTEKYYIEMGMVFGIIFGAGIGLSVGTVINQTIGITIGLSIGAGIGMVFGMLFGARKDTEAKRQGNVILKKYAMNSNIIHKVYNHPLGKKINKQSIN